MQKPIILAISFVIIFEYAYIVLMKIVVLECYLYSKTCSALVLYIHFCILNKKENLTILNTNIDILENEILREYPEVLDKLLLDHTTGQNIFWATNNYEHLGNDYRFDAPILKELITGKNGSVIMPRVQKDKLLQQSRSKDMAEVFTPSWVCNAQNNLIDDAWFGRKNVFNTETDFTSKKSWQVNPDKIEFPDNKSWNDYIKDTRLEIACGEAPYITSRYDTTTGDFIPVENRIGILDRKLRIVNENTNKTSEWLKAAHQAYKNTYAYEWQGDSLLIAREAMLVTFIENYKLKFGEEPLLKSIQYVAYIIACNVWQMDGLKGVIPNSCKPTVIEENGLFEKFTKEIPCEGCRTDNIYKHTGTYCLIKDWNKQASDSGKKGRKFRFIDLLKK